MKLIERGKRLNQQVEVWMCDDMEEVKLLPKNIPTGSLVLVTSDDGLIIQIKNSKGQWKEL